MSAGCSSWPSSWRRLHPADPPVPTPSRLRAPTPTWGAVETSPQAPRFDSDTAENQGTRCRSGLRPRPPRSAGVRPAGGTPRRCTWCSPPHRPDAPASEAWGARGADTPAGTRPRSRSVRRRRSRRARRASPPGDAAAGGAAARRPADPGWSVAAAQRWPPGTAPRSTIPLGWPRRRRRGRRRPAAAARTPARDRSCTADGSTPAPHRAGGTRG